MRSKKEILLLEKLEAAAREQGFDLVDIERAGSGRNALLRVFVDKEDGLTLDEVAAANSWVARVVEEQDLYKGSYTLEVSSPGIDRPLRTLAHFQKAKGEEAAIALDSATVDNADGAEHTKPRLKYTGVITDVDAGKQTITLLADDGAHTLQFAQIKKARIKGQLDFNKKQRD